MTKLYRIMNADKVPEGTLTNMVGVHPVRWHDVVIGAVTEPTLVAVEDPQAEVDMKLAEMLRRLPNQWAIGCAKWPDLQRWYVWNTENVIQGQGATPDEALQVALAVTRP